ncbi:MAG: hypothetical protein RR382_00235 [Tannerellaceae bacterium]
MNVVSITEALAALTRIIACTSNQRKVCSVKVDVGSWPIFEREYYRCEDDEYDWVFIDGHVPRDRYVAENFLTEIKTPDSDELQRIRNEVDICCKEDDEYPIAYFRITVNLLVNRCDLPPNAENPEDAIINDKLCWDYFYKAQDPSAVRRLSDNRIVYVLQIEQPTNHEDSK